jgi:hypothetical protein
MACFGKRRSYASGPPASPTGFSTSNVKPCIRLNVTVSVGVAGYWDADEDKNLTGYGLAADEIDLISITTPASGTCSADALVLRLSATVTAGGHMKGVIYSDSGGAPNALLATGTQVTVAGANAELTSTFSGVTLQPSTTYWIGSHSDNASRLIEKGGASKFKGGQTYASGTT